MPVPGYPLLRWITPTAVVRSFSFPEYATDFHHEVISSFVQSKTVGNVVSHYSKGAYDEVQVEFIGDFSQSFADEVRAWWGHAARGGVFDFFLEGDLINTAPLHDFTYPPFDLAVVNFAGGSPPFIVGRELTVAGTTAAGDTARRGSFTLSTQTQDIPLYGPDKWKLGIALPSTLVRWHYPDEVVRSKYGFPDSVVLQGDYPLREEPGNIMRFSLQFRSLAAIVTP